MRLCNSISLFSQTTCSYCPAVLKFDMVSSMQSLNCFFLPLKLSLFCKIFLKLVPLYAIACNSFLTTFAAFFLLVMPATTTCVHFLQVTFKRSPSIWPNPSSVNPPHITIPMVRCLLFRSTFCPTPSRHKDNSLLSPYSNYYLPGCYKASPESAHLQKVLKAGHQQWQDSEDYSLAST